MIIISVLPSGRFLAPDPCPVPFPQSILLTGCCMRPRRDTHGVHRPWYSPKRLPTEGAHGTEGRFQLWCHTSLGIHFSEVGSSSFLSRLLRLPFTICIDAVGQFSLFRFHRISQIHEPVITTLLQAHAYHTCMPYVHTSNIYIFFIHQRNIDGNAD